MSRAMSLMRWQPSRHHWAEISRTIKQPITPYLEQQVAERTAALQQGKPWHYLYVPDPLSADGWRDEWSAVEVGADRLLLNRLKSRLVKLLHEVFSREQADEFLAYTHQVLALNKCSRSSTACRWLTTTWFRLNSPIRLIRYFISARHYPAQQAEWEALYSAVKLSSAISSKTHRSASSERAFWWINFSMPINAWWSCLALIHPMIIGIKRTDFFLCESSWIAPASGWTANLW